MLHVKVVKIFAHINVKNNTKTRLNITENKKTQTYSQIDSQRKIWSQPPPSHNNDDDDDGVVMCVRSFVWLFVLLFVVLCNAPLYRCVAIVIIFFTEGFNFPLV